MKEIFIKSLRKDMEVTDFFMVKSSAIRTGANGKQYLDITLGDKTGEVSAKKWDVSEAEQESLVQIKEKEIVKIKGLVTEWAGQLQLRIQRIRKAAAEDGQAMADFVKAAPEDTGKMYEEVFHPPAGTIPHFYSLDSFGHWIQTICAQKHVDLAKAEITRQEKQN